MNKQTEALKMAIEALVNDALNVAGELYLERKRQYAGYPKEYEYYEKVLTTLDDTIQACKEALAQPAQEPVAWTTDNQLDWLENENNNTSIMWNNNNRVKMGIKQECKIIPLYTHPAPSWQGCESLGDFDKLSKSECVDYIEYLRKEIDLLRFKDFVGLSDDERHEVIVKHVTIDCTCDPYEFARAIEQALRSKNER